MKKMEMNFNWKCIIPTVEIKHDTQRIATMRGGQKESGICHVFPVGLMHKAPNIPSWTNEGAWTLYTVHIEQFT